MPNDLRSAAIYVAEVAACDERDCHPMLTIMAQAALPLALHYLASAPLQDYIDDAQETPRTPEET